MLKRITYQKIYIYFICIYFLSLPLNALKIGALGSVLKLLAVMPIVIALFGSGKMRIHRSLVMQLVFTLFAGLSIIWTIADNETSGRIVSYALLLTLLLSGCFFSYTKQDLLRIKAALVWSSRLTVVCILLFGTIIANRLYLGGLLQEDPNYLCAYFSFGVIDALQRLLSQEKKTDKFWACVELVMYMYIILLTGSRGGLLAIMAGVGVFLLFHGRFSMKRTAKTLFLISLLAIIFVTLMNFLPEELSRRFTIEDIRSRGGSGRMEIWSTALAIFGDSPLLRQLFGYGSATVRNIFLRHGFLPKVMHNMFLEILLELGVIGVIIYIETIFSFAKTSYKNVDKFAFSIIVCMIVLSLSTSIYTFKPYFNIMLYIIMLARNHERKDNSQLCI